jgi:hypothetical protein
MKTNWGSDVYLHAYLTLASDGGEWSASRLGRFTPRERAPGTHWIGGCVGPRVGQDTVTKRKIPSPRRESNPDSPIVQPIASSYIDWAIPALTDTCNYYLRYFSLSLIFRDKSPNGYLGP